MQKKSFSWGIIALMFILFFPIGIFMLIKKMTDEKFNYIKNGKALRIFAFILIGIGILYLIMGITGELETEDGSNVLFGVIVMLLIFVGGGSFSLYKANWYIKKGTKYNRYVSIVNSSTDTLIDNIAAAYPTSFEEASSDLQSMINDGYFMNAYVDLNSRELIMPQRFTDSQTVVNQGSSSANGQLESVKCKNCGATNKVASGTAGECEYCGSPL